MAVRLSVVRILRHLIAKRKAVRVGSASFHKKSFDIFAKANEVVFVEQLLTADRFSFGNSL